MKSGSKSYRQNLCSKSWYVCDDLEKIVIKEDKRTVRKSAEGLKESLGCLEPVLKCQKVAQRGSKRDKLPKSEAN